MTGRPDAYPSPFPGPRPEARRAPRLGLCRKGIDLGPGPGLIAGPMQPATPGIPAASPTASLPTAALFAALRLRSALDAFARTGLPTGAECPAFRDAVREVEVVGRLLADALRAADLELSRLRDEAEAEVVVAQARLDALRGNRVDLWEAALHAAGEGEAPCNPAARFDALAESPRAVDSHLRAVLVRNLVNGLARDLMAADFALGQTTSGCPGRRAVARAAADFARRT